MLSLDGVIQAPGGPEEDPSNGFAYGGWTAPYSDDILNDALKEELAPADYLLGRKTFEIWENYWPDHATYWPGINDGVKYVLSKTRTTSDWKNSVFIESISDIRKIKDSKGGDIQIWGSSELVHLLLEHDLVDELRLKIYPLTLGKGKKLFDDFIHPSAFSLSEHIVTKTGVILANYRRSGQVETGDFTTS